LWCSVSQAAQTTHAVKSRVSADERLAVVAAKGSNPVVILAEAPAGGHQLSSSAWRSASPSLAQRVEGPQVEPGRGFRPEEIEHVARSFERLRKLAQDDLGETLSGEFVPLEPLMGFVTNSERLECHTQNRDESDGPGNVLMKSKRPDSLDVGCSMLVVGCYSLLGSGEQPTSDNQHPTSNIHCMPQSPLARRLGLGDEDLGLGDC